MKKFTNRKEKTVENEMLSLINRNLVVELQNQGYEIFKKYLISTHLLNFFIGDLDTLKEKLVCQHENMAEIWAYIKNIEEDLIYILSPLQKDILYLLRNHSPHLYCNCIEEIDFRK